ncbi:MAG: GNAT family N-acetyltransferase [Lachnospiraceae bacterium]|nr:GNAT family N-acetyltransferase [Lachnospiraceae bacterium]
MSVEKVYIRPITDADTEKIVTWRNQDFVRKNFIYQKLFTEEGHRAWLKNQVEPGHVAQFIICVEGLGEIGSVYLRDIDREKGTAEYGAFIGEEKALGCGYGTQAARLILDYGFGTLGLEYIFLRLLEKNSGARRSYEKAGFRRIENKREIVNLEQGACGVLFMKIDRSMWEARDAD